MAMVKKSAAADEGDDVQWSQQTSVPVPHLDEKNRRPGSQLAVGSAKEEREREKKVVKRVQRGKRTSQGGKGERSDKLGKGGVPDRVEGLHDGARLVLLAVQKEQRIRVAEPVRVHCREAGCVPHCGLPFTGQK